MLRVLCFAEEFHLNKYPLERECQVEGDAKEESAVLQSINATQFST